MNEFVFLYRGGATEREQRSRSSEQMEQQMNRWRSWAEKLAKEGHLKDFGVPLQHEGKNVAAGGVVTDGPFAEGKEVIGGFSIIKAKDLAEASEIAKGCPIFEFPDGRVEVRPVQPM